ncbi:hypothetical protein [Janthinobacterium sp. MP5059B]|uniref:hypothetical protein n=1 Tax=Janthinobacterium sp. MP5059B TaxID=1766683 RepID=UPI001586F616|nr:hypothetical protein [Janthinobacterium sp. MP5059B]
MTGTISTFSCVFLLYPCALKQRFNRLPHFAKPVFFCLDFRTGLENTRRRRNAAPGAGA